ncbi:MAG: hypothetical protein EZS28_052467, partial [Streblomastix strix]
GVNQQIQDNQQKIQTIKASISQALQQPQQQQQQQQIKLQQQQSQSTNTSNTASSSGIVSVGPVSRIHSKGIRTTKNSPRIVVQQIPSSPSIPSSQIPASYIASLSGGQPTPNKKQQQQQNSSSSSSSLFPQSQPLINASNPTTSPVGTNATRSKSRDRPLGVRVSAVHPVMLGTPSQTKLNQVSSPINANNAANVKKIDEKK